jgi:2-isopropylmalate synthase
VQELADELGRELQAGDIWGVFRKAYRLDAPQHFQLVDYDEQRGPDGTRVFAGKIEVDGQVRTVSGRGNGLISSVVATLAEGFGVNLEVRDYSEHAMGSGTNARAAYVECVLGDGRVVWGVGIDEDVATASVHPFGGQRQPLIRPGSRTRPRASGVGAFSCHLRYRPRAFRPWHRDG